MTLERRSRLTDYTVREEANSKIIAGYFIVFETETEIYPGYFEKISKDIFKEGVPVDVRALTNHDTTLVLGRGKAGTLKLTVDEKGLYAEITINENDADALNLYERVKRGDVSECSFGFYILEHEEEFRSDGTVLDTIKKIELFEISVVTFAQYETTNAEARTKNARQKLLEMRRNEIKKKIMEVKNA